MLKTVDLIKTFRTEEVETTALNKVNLEIQEKEFVAIMGPSGCGKSTLLNILGLLDNPSAGEYYFNGIEVSRYREGQRTKLRKGNIGFIFESFNLIDELNVYENVELPLLYLRTSASERKRLVNEVLDRMQSVWFVGRHDDEVALVKHVEGSSNFGLCSAVKYVDQCVVWCRVLAQAFSFIKGKQSHGSRFLVDYCTAHHCPLLVLQKT